MEMLWKGPVLTLVFFVVVGCMSLIATSVRPTTPPPTKNLQETYHPVYYVVTTVGDAGSGCDL